MKKAICILLLTVMLCSVTVSALGESNSIPFALNLTASFFDEYTTSEILSNEVYRTYLVLSLLLDAALDDGNVIGESINAGELLANDTYVGRWGTALVTGYYDDSHLVVIYYDKVAKEASLIVTESTMPRTLLASVFEADELSPSYKTSRSMMSDLIEIVAGALAD